jgi:hypothetical protein
MAESGSMHAISTIFTSSTRPYAVLTSAWIEPSWVMASSPPATTVAANAASATGVNLLSRTRACCDRQPPGGRTPASAAIPPAQRPAAMRWTASSVIPYQAGSAPAAWPPAASITSAPASHTGSVLEPRTTAMSVRISNPRRAISAAPERLLKNAAYSDGLCPPEPTVASAQTTTSPAERAMLEARKLGVTHSSDGGRSASRRMSTCPARNSRPSASTHLMAPIAMSDGCGPGTALAATSGAAAPATPTSKVNVPAM